MRWSDLLSTIVLETSLDLKSSIHQLMLLEGLIHRLGSGYFPCLPLELLFCGPE